MKSAEILVSSTLSSLTQSSGGKVAALRRLAGKQKPPPKANRCWKSTSSRDLWRDSLWCSRRKWVLKVTPSWRIGIRSSTLMGTLSWECRSFGRRACLWLKILCRSSWGVWCGLIWWRTGWGWVTLCTCSCWRGESRTGWLRRWGCRSRRI